MTDDQSAFSSCFCKDLAHRNGLEYVDSEGSNHLFQRMVDIPNRPSEEVGVTIVGGRKYEITVFNDDDLRDEGAVTYMLKNRLSRPTGCFDI